MWSTESESLQMMPLPQEDQGHQILKPRKRYIFKIYRNPGAGDCLFLALAEFLKKSHPRIQKDVVREEIVNYIVGSDNSSPSSVWSKYRQGVKLALEKHVPFFRNYSLEEKGEEDEEVERRAREEYKRYMIQPHVYGTYVELCAAMEKFSFHTTLIEETSSSSVGNDVTYNICHLDVESSGRFRRRAFIAFTGCIDSGHFEYLEPIKPKRPNIPKGFYQLEQPLNHPETLTLVLVPRNEANEGPSTGIKSRPATQSESNNFKRTFIPNDLPKASVPPCKKLKYLEGISNNEQLEETPYLPDYLKEKNNLSHNTILFQLELQSLAQFYLSAINKLKENFEGSNESSTGKDWPGVSHSEVEKFGPFQTVFFQFEAESFISLSPETTNLYVIVYHNKVLSVDEFEASGEHICRSSKTQEFFLEPGKLYTLENHTQEIILVRFLWTDSQNPD